MSWNTIDVICDKCGADNEVEYSDYDLHDEMDCYHDNCYTDSDVDHEVQARVRLLNDVLQKAHAMLGHPTLSIINCYETPCRDVP